MSHVDSTSPVTHVSLCAGYGGIDLGLHRAIPNLRTIAVSEIEAFACANLVAKMEAGLLDPAPIWTDLKTFPWAEFRDRVDILSGGYPCQPFSAAGKRLGAEDPRHLWPFISAGIAAMRPSVCFFENVEGHISLGLSDVIEDLDRLGYRATWCVASASECGAPHQRKRVFILAYDAHGEQRAWSLLRQNWQGSAVSLGCGSGRAEELANAGRSSIRERAWSKSEISSNNHACGQVLGQAWPSRPGEQQHAWEPPRVVSGLANPTSAGSGSEGGDAVHQGWSPSDAWATSVSQDSERQVGAAVADDQSAGRDGAAAQAVADSKKSGRIGERIAGDMDGETSPEGSRGHQLAPTIADCGDAGASEDPRLPNAQDMRFEEQSECGQQHQADGSGPSNPSGVCACEAQEGRSVEHASDWSNGEQPTEQQGRHSIGGSSEEGAMGNAAHTNRRPRVSAEEAGAGPDDIWRRRSGESGDDAMGNTKKSDGRQQHRHREVSVRRADESRQQTQPPLGRDADGPADWLDDAELYTTCDNRTDELRLLGNGVVPAVAERAFRLLVGELMEHQP
jgi:site-specific DNA-cytosine methylase